MRRPRIAIATYSRWNELMKMTLAYISGTDFPLSRVDLFVVDDQRDEYEKALRGARIKVGGIHHADVTLKAARMSISNFYDEGDPIVCMDDDVAMLGAAVTRKGKLEAITKLEAFLDFAFSETMQRGAALWGVYPVGNPFYMRNGITTDLRLICGYTYGCLNTRDQRMQVKVSQKEDYERSILFYKRDGAVVRFNRIAGDHQYTKTRGGMQGQRKQNTDAESIKYLLKKYPMFCKPVWRWERYELKLVDRALEGLKWE